MGGRGKVYNIYQHHAAIVGFHGSEAREIMLKHRTHNLPIFGYKGNWGIWSTLFDNSINALLPEGLMEGPFRVEYRVCGIWALR